MYADSRVRARVAGARARRADRGPVTDASIPDSPFHGIEKNQVLQEAKMFNSSETVTRHPRRCRRVLTKLLYLILMGDHYSGSEASEVFFGVTKLFQSSNVRAEAGQSRQRPSRRRRSVTRPRSRAAPPPGRPPAHDVPVHQGSGREHVQRGGAAARCGAGTPDCAAHGGPGPASQVIIVVSSLTKDMNSSEDLYRGNAIRVLAKIIDVRWPALAAPAGPPLTRARRAAPPTELHAWAN